MAVPLIMCSCNPIVCYTSSASREALCASRSAPLRPELCACRAASIGATRSRRRGPLGVTQSPSRVSFHTTPRRSPLRLNSETFPSNAAAARRALRKAVAQSLGNLIDKDRVHTGNVIQDLSVFDHATTVCVAHRSIARAFVSPLSARTGYLQTLERSLREPHELPDSPEPLPRMGQMSSAYKHALAWSLSLRG